MLVTPDVSELADEVTPGTYRGVITKAESGEWSTGTKYVKWTLETTGESESKNNGRRIYHKTPVMGRGAFQLQKLYKAATGRPLTGSFDTEELVGKVVALEVVDGVNRETGEPTGYIEVKNVRPVQG